MEPSRRRLLPQPALVVLVVAFVLDALLWAAVVSVGYPPDELSHTDYARRLLLEHRLPTYGVTRYVELPYPLPHASMPPLYYALELPLAAAAAARGLGTLDTVFVLRLLSVALGALTVVLAWRLGRLLAPDRPEFALAVAALVGFNPMFTFLCGSVNSDDLLNLVGAALACHLTRALLAGDTSRRWVLGLGALVGVALLAKPAIAGDLGAAAVALVLLAGRGERFRWGWLLRAGAMVALVALAIAGWFYLHNWRAYGDPTGITVVGSRPDVYSPQPYRATGPLALMLFGSDSRRPFSFFSGLWRGYWGIFDHWSVLMPGRLYGLAGRITLAGLAGAALALVRAWKRRHLPEVRTRLAVAAVGATAFLLTLASVAAACYRIDYQAQGRYLFPAITFLAVMIVVGCEELAGLLRARRYVAPLLVVAVLALNVAALVTTVWPSHRHLYLRNLAPRTAHGIGAVPARLDVDLAPGAERVVLLARSVIAGALPLSWTLTRAGDAPASDRRTVTVSGAGPFLLSIDVSKRSPGHYALTLEAGAAGDRPVLYVGSSDTASGDAGPRVIGRRGLDAKSWSQLLDGLRTGEPERLRSRLLPALILLVPPALLVLASVALVPVAGRAAALLALVLLAGTLALAGPPLQIVTLPTVVGDALACARPSSPLR